jgi:hypothetical protein
VKIGTWLAPRYTERGVFEKDFPGIDMHGLEVYCPGCKDVLRLARKSQAGKIAGWCRRCNRAAAP